MTKQQLYPLIKSLKNKAIVNATFNRPAEFSAVNIEKVLDLLTKAKFEEAKVLRNNKEQLLTDWETINISKTQHPSEKFTVIKGRNYVYSKIQQMIQETKNQFSVISTLAGLLRADQFGVLDTIQNHPMKYEIQFRFITELSNQNIDPIKHLLKNLNPRLRVKARNTDIGLSLFPKMVLRDKEEILYFISPTVTQFEDQDEYTCLLTNCQSLVEPFSNVFEDLWSKSTEIKQKILEIETGTPAQRTLVIEDPDLASAKYNKALKKAKKDIIMATSSEEILLYWKNSSVLKELTSIGVSIKIMAPISRKNLKAALDLSKLCQVRHVPNEYLKTVLIDGKHLFQFKITSQKKQKSEGKIEQTFYSNDFEYVEKTKKMLLDIWNNSVIPSSKTVESIVDNQSPFPEPLIKKNSKHKFVDILYTTDQYYNNTQEIRISDQDVINKIQAYKKHPKANSESITLCGTVGHAIIHPHNGFDFPDLLIAAYHVDEESSFGAEDALLISLWFNTSKGFRYVPVAIVGDNPKASEQWIRAFENTLAPARKNYNLFKKDEIQIQVHGNTFFAGWTRPIPLLHHQNCARTLPPAAIILEATGRIRPRAFKYALPKGLKYEQSFNYYDAFVTFIHQKTKYQGPSTDGLLAREMLHNAHLNK